MKILVTGGSGLVGNALKELQNEEKKEGQEFIYLLSKNCDLRESVKVDELFNKIKPDIVIHLAAKVGGLYCNLDNNYQMLIDNIKINTNILECCNKYKIKRLINILSTCIFPEENEDNNLSYPLTSNQILNGRPHASNSGYAHAKRILYIGSKLLSNISNTQVVNLIPTNLYGKHDNYNINKSHVMPGLIHKCFIAKENIENKNELTTSCSLIIKGTGNAKRQFLYANDFAKVIYFFVNCKLTKNCNSLIVSPPKEEEITIKELANKITSILKFKGKVIYDKDYSDGQPIKTTDSNELLKYIPDFKFTNLNDGMTDTINYFIENYDILRK